MSDLDTYFEDDSGGGSKVPEPQRQGISSAVDLVPIVAQLETGGNRDPDNAVSEAGAVGRHQIMPSTAKQYGFDPEKLTDPEHNKRAATAILNDLYKRYNGDVAATLIAYNAGPKVADRWVKAGRTGGLPEQTVGYLSKARQLAASEPTLAEGPLAQKEVQVANNDQQMSDMDRMFGPAVPGGAEDQSKSQVSQDNNFRIPKQLFQAAEGGVQQLAGAPGSLLQFAKAHRPDWVPYVNKLAPFANAIENFFPTGDQLESESGWGMSQHPELTPQNTPERLMVAGAEGLPSAALLTGGMSIPKALGVSSGSNIAAAEAHELAPDNPWLPPTVGLVTSLGIGGGTEMAKHAIDIGRSVKNVIGSAAAVAEAQAKNASSTVQKTLSAQNLRNTKDLTTKAIAAAHDNFKQTMGQLADKLGTSDSLQSLGEKIQDYARDWKERIMPQKLADARTPLDVLMPNETPTPLSAFKGAVTGLHGEGGSLSGVIDVLSGKLPEKLEGRLEARDQLAKMQAAEKAATDAKAAGLPEDQSKLKANEAMEAATAAPPTFAEAQKLRTTLGYLKANPKLLKDADQRTVDALYAAITKDLGGAAKSVSPEAKEAWDAFNEKSTALYHFAGNKLSDLVKHTDPVQDPIWAEQVGKKVVREAKNGGTRLQAFRNEMPGAADEVASYHLRTDPESFVGGKTALSREAQAALASDPAHAQAIARAAAQRRQEIQQAEDTLARAQGRHQTNTDAAATAKFGVRDAKTGYALAKDKVDALGELKNAVFGASQSAGGFAIMNKLAPWLAEQMGMPNHPLVEAALDAVGTALPAITRGTIHMIKKPHQSTAAAIGAVAGQNALSVPVPPEAE